MNLRFSLRVSGTLSRTINRSLQQIAESVRDELRKNTPGKTGRAGRRWVIQPPGDGEIRITNRTGYLPYLIRGTGLYGPHHQRILPKKGKILVWSDGGTRVCARSVRGIRPMPFVRDSVEEGVKAWRQRT